MKKSYILLLLVVFATGLSVFYAYHNRDIYTDGPFKLNSVFDNLSCAVSDSQGNLYLIDKSRKRILKVDSSGTLAYMIKAKSSLISFTDIVAGDDGALYVLDEALDSQGEFVESQEISRYTQEGNFDSSLYRVEYKNDQDGRIRTLKIKDGFLYFYHAGQDEKVLLNKVSLDGKDVKNVFTTFIPKGIYLSDIAGVEPNSVYYSTRKGRIYKVNSVGEQVLVYSGEDRGKSLPAYLDVDPEKKVYFADVSRKEISRLSPAGNALTETILSGKILSLQGYDIPFEFIKNIYAAKDGSIIVAVSDSQTDRRTEYSSIDRVICVRPDGKVDFVKNKADYPLKFLFYRWSVWLQVLLIPLLLLFAWKILYIDILQRKVFLLLRQSIMFIPVIAISMLIVSGIVYLNYSKRYDDEVVKKLKLFTYLGTQLIEGDRLEKITQPGNFMNDDYKVLKDRISLMYQDKSPIKNERIYVDVYKVEEGQLYTIIENGDTVSPYTPFQIRKNVYYKVMGSGKFKDGKELVNDKDAETSELKNDQEKDAGGEWMYAIGPIRNSSGKIVGVFESGLNKNRFNEKEKELFWNTGQGIAITTVVIVALFLLITYFLLQSIRILRKGVNEVAKGNWDTVVSVTSRDEVADLCEGFNKMSAFIRKYISEITILSESYFRFVPQKFIKFLGKDSIADVQLGDQVKQEMSILFSSIRSFNVFSENLTPEESFNLINSFLKRIGPIIRNNGGFIEQYLGPGVIALFPGEPGDALRAAVEMRRELEIYNGYRRNSGYEPLDIGIGIHKGPLMFGIIGEEQRLQGAVVSDAVDLAAAIEKSTQRFGASILITEKLLTGLPEQYQYRFLGLVRVESKEEPVYLYDLFEGDVEIVRKIKQETKDLFEEGIMLYQDGRFYDARSRFVEVIKQNYRDEAAKIYFFLCDEYFKKGAPEKWGGTLIA